MTQISLDMVKLDDTIEALEFLLEKKGVVYYTGGSKEWRPQAGAAYPVEVPEAIWEVGADQTLEFLDEQLSEATTIFGVLFEY